MSRARNGAGQFVSAERVAEERLDERAGLIRALLGGEDESSLSMSILGAVESERDLMNAIGRTFVDGDDHVANDMRDRLYRTQTLREICERLLDQVRS